jgi:hypothetical protein
MEVDQFVPNRRRSARILRREVEAVANDGLTDYATAFRDLVSLGREMHTVLRVLTEMSMFVGAEGSTDAFHRTLDSIERTQQQFAFKHPGMLRIGHCRDMYVSLCARIMHCREILAVAETLPPETLSAAACAALPGHTPADGEVCTVCCDGGDETWLRLPCGHAFHRSCATEWLSNRQRTCPLCRQEVTPV